MGGGWGERKFIGIVDLFLTQQCVCAGQLSMGVNLQNQWDLDYAIRWYTFNFPVVVKQLYSDVSNSTIRSSIEIHCHL